MTPTGLGQKPFHLWEIVACDLCNLLILSGSCICALFGHTLGTFSSDPTMPISIMAASTAKTFYWEVFPPMPTCRVYCTPAFQDGHLFVVGGCSKTGLPLDSVEMLDVASQKWMTLPPLPTARAGAAAVVVEKQVLIIGGMDSEQSPLASVEIYNMDEGKWERKADLGQPSMGITAIESGDSGYALMSWLITPLRHPRTNAETNFNRSHVSTRNTIERAFGLLKSRFRCLHVSGGALLYDPEFCCRIITTCAALHNICVRRNIPLPEPEEPDPSDADEHQGQQSPPEDENPGQRAAGQSIRDTLINNLFTRL